MKWIMRILTLLFAHTPWVVLAGVQTPGVQTPGVEPAKRIIQKQPEMNNSSAEPQSLGADPFFDQNKKKAGVIMLPNGLQYKVIKQGSGPKPGPRDFVKMHYQGKLLDGSVFDSSEKYGPAPETFEVFSLVKGLEDAVQLMSPGSIYEVYVPANLGYGEKGIKGKVPPNAPLIFTVELLEIVPRPDDSDTNILERDDVEELRENKY